MYYMLKVMLLVLLHRNMRSAQAGHVRAPAPMSAAQHPLHNGFHELERQQDWPQEEPGRDAEEVEDHLQGGQGRQQG